MTNYFPLPLLLLLATLISPTPTFSPESPPPLLPPSSFPPPQPPSFLPQTAPQEPQLNNIVDALIGSGDFGNWANILSFLDPSIMPFSATIFVPNDDAFSLFPTPAGTFDPSLFPYHIIPQRLSFSELSLFDINSRLPTLLPEKSILLTNNSATNFTVDDTRVICPDLCSTEGVSVHGINGVLDFETYGNGEVVKPGDEQKPLKPDNNVVKSYPPLPPVTHPVQSFPPSPSQLITTPPPPAVAGIVMGISDAGRSDGFCLGTHFSMGISVLCALLL